MRPLSNLTNGLAHFVPLRSLRPESVARRESVIDSKVKMLNAIRRDFLGLAADPLAAPQPVANIKLCTT